VHRISYEVFTSGRGRLALGRARVTSSITGQAKEFSYAVLHFGDQNITAAVKAYSPADSEAFERVVAQTRIQVRSANFPEVIRLLDRYCKLDKGTDFVGRDALMKVQEAGGPARKLVGLEMIDRGIGRDGYPVYDAAGLRIGEITSGSPAPFLKKNIALAYVPVAFTDVGTEVFVEVRDQKVKAQVVPTPFYKKPKKT